jgi:hypothetical protein
MGKVLFPLKAGGIRNPVKAKTLSVKIPDKGDKVSSAALTDA